MKWVRDTPWWVFAICLSLASIEPITHFCLQRIDNDEMVFSGLHTPDSAIYLTCMKMLDNDFYSPYATCKAPNGPNDPAFLPTPFHWLYAILGEMGRWFGFGEFMFLGLANGVFGFVYLVVVFRFMKTVAPELANLAFVLWSLGGGLGGVMLLTAWGTGAIDSNWYSARLFSLFMYELHEGPGLLPVLHLPRLYYTASLALGFGALILILGRAPSRMGLSAAGLLFLGASLINLRFGGIFLGVVILHQWLFASGTARDRTVTTLTLASVLVLAALVYFRMSTFNPAAVQSNFQLVRQSVWPTGFVAVALPQLLLVLIAVWMRAARLPRVARALTTAAIGYLALLAMFFVGHTLYFGNFLQGSDHAALNHFSDFALIGGLIGFGIGWIGLPVGAGDPFVAAESRVERPAAGDGTHSCDFPIVWLLAFMVLGMSAFGQGWGQRLGPQRFLVLIGVPMSLVSAFVLMRIAAEWPRTARGYAGGVVALGVVSIATASIVFQSPVGQRLPTPMTRAMGAIERSDSRLIDHLEPGIVMVSGPIADVIALRAEMRVVSGVGSTDLSDRPAEEVNWVTGSFFMGDAEFRVDVLREWCVDLLFWPTDFWADPETLESIRQSDVFEEIASDGGGAVFRVKKDVLNSEVSRAN